LQGLLNFSTFPVDNFVRNRAWNALKRLLRLAAQEIARFQSTLPTSIKSTT
jgi:hypothetical protein